VHEVLAEPGRPLDAETLPAMNARFDHDFSEVRVHTDSRAAESAEAVSARAYTVGEHIVFDANGNRPEVLAHELGHVVQQRGVHGIPTSGLPIGDAHDPAETAGATGPAGSVPVLRRQLAPDAEPPGVRKGVTRSAETQAMPGFDTGSADLSPVQRARLMMLAADLNTHPLTAGDYATIVGSADRRGRAGENRELAQRRADAAREFLSRFLIDDDTLAAIRAYSQGAPTEGPVVDDPSLRSIDVTITRRTMRLPAPTPTPQLRTDEPPVHVPDGRTWILPDPVPKPTLPDWFWHELRARRPEPSTITQLSTWLNGALNTKDFTGLAADIAHVFGLDRGKVRDTLNAAAQTGIEAAVKALLQMVIDAGVGALKGQAPPGPTPGPPQIPSPPVKKSPDLPL
jgi:outer membrane protein OmpA-like peptidoglycan-associated protein